MTASQAGSSLGGRLLQIVIAPFAGMLAAGPAVAQDDPAPVPPAKLQASPGGVDMRTGQLLYTHTDLSIGGEEGLQLTRHFSPVTSGMFTPGTFGGFNHNWDVRVNEKRIKVSGASTPLEYDYQVTVSGSRGTTYRTWWPASSGDFVNSSNGIFTWLDFEDTPHPTTGAPRPSRYTYRATDGSRIEFRPTGTVISGGADECGIKCAFASQISDADGTTYTLSYNAYAGTTTPRLRSVVSNRGYALLFEYGAPGSAGAGQVTRACALNLAYITLPAITGEQICPGGVPTSTYSYTSGLLTSFTDQSGVATNLGARGSALYWPGESSPYVTNTIVTSGFNTYVTAQSFADGRSYAYSWVWDGNSPGSIMGGSYTDNNARTVTVEYGKYHGPPVADPTWYVTDGPEAVTDEIGRTWSYYYNCSGSSRCYPLPVRRITEPEGNKIQLTYGDFGNITERRQNPKAGSGLADIVSSSTFPSPCSSWFNCNKPLTTTDANGNTTTYTYDATHGGILTESGPAVDGVIPRKKYSYAQRYAWISTGGGHAQASSPVWVLAEERSCRTSTLDLSTGACAAGASDLVITAYEYGPDSGPNNLWLRGVAVTADAQTLRTCYGYDTLGRRISETQPNANLSSCP